MVVAAGLLVTTFSMGRERGESELGDLHARAKHDRHVVQIAELKRDIKEVAGINDTGRVVHDQSNASQAGLSVNFNQILLTAEFFLGVSQDGDAGMKHEFIAVFYLHVLGLRINAFHGIDRLGRMRLVDYERVSESDVVSSRLKLLDVKRLERDLSSFYRRVNVFIA